MKTRKEERERGVLSAPETHDMRWTSETVFDDLLKGKAKMAVVGLGYVGLPIALEFARSMNVIGFDVKEERVEMMRNAVDPSCELDETCFEDKKIMFTSNPMQMQSARVYIVAVPTPVDESNAPNLKALKRATTAVAKCLDRGDYVIFESTVYPGCTEEVCLPILEKFSGLEVNKDFKMGYSPERINPGDKEHTLTTITKVVSGSDEDACDEIAKIYGHVITAGVHKASCIKVAEASKIVENTQRDVNIALMNELSMIFDKMDISTLDVLAAAGTKWNFLNFHPGLVGGHCIGVDPYYLIHKARMLKVDADVMKSSRMINDWMPYEIVHRLHDALKEKGRTMEGAKVLIKGATFKEDVTDVRNSKAMEIAKILKMKHVEVHVVDPHADETELKNHYDMDLTEDVDGDYDAIIVAVSHSEYRGMTTTEMSKCCRTEPVIFDVKGIITNDNGASVITL